MKKSNIKIEKINPIASERIEAIFQNFIKSPDYKEFKQVIKNLEDM